MYARLFDFLGSRNAIFAFAAVVAGAGILLGLNALLSHPTEADAREIVYGDLLRYEKLHDHPHVVFRHNERIYFDELKRDYKYFIPQQSLGWVLTGMWYFIPISDEPASVGVARCTGVIGEGCAKWTELFGQINSAEITAIEVVYDGEWHRFPVEAPGYAVRLDGFGEAPSGYRWLDDDGGVVHEEGMVEPLTPGR